MSPVPSLLDFRYVAVMFCLEWPQETLPFVLVIRVEHTQRERLLEFKAGSYQEHEGFPDEIISNHARKCAGQ